MIRNYLFILMRSFRKNPITSIVNISGLAISLMACLIIVIVIQNELKFDKSHPDAERMYRITEVIDRESFVENSSSLPYPVMDALNNDYPDLIESSVRITHFMKPTRSFMLEDNEKYTETFVFYADSNLFTLFDIPLIQGNPEEVINRPYTAVINEKTGKKYFGDENPVGKILKLSGVDRLAIEITGVMGKGGPSHFNPNIVISMKTAQDLMRGLSYQWIWNPVWTYVKLKPGIEPDALESQFPEFVQKYYPERHRPMISHYMQPITDIHLHSDLEFEMEQNGNINYIYIFFFSALFLLVIASINFINLTTINLSLRIKEIGIRKVVGASRKQLIIQFLIESVLITLIAFVLALLLTLAVFPFLLVFLGLEIDINNIINWEFIGVLLTVLIVTGVISGLYPSYMLSGTKVINVFKGGLKGSPKARLFRKGLVVFQFAIATVLIVFTVTSRLQVNYMHQNDKGFATENIIVIRTNTRNISNETGRFKSRLKEHPLVRNVSYMDEILGIANNNHEFNHDKLTLDEWHFIPALMVDEDFIKTYEIELIAGRDFDPTKFREDSLSIIVNETLTKSLGFIHPEEALGKRYQSIKGGREKIIGVTADFNYKSLHNDIGPFVLDLEDRRNGLFQISANHAAVNVIEINPDVLSHLEAVWNEFVPNKPFFYSLMSDEVGHQYKSERKMNLIVAIFSSLAILVACMGIFALSWFIAGQKLRELAVRKTFGAPMIHLLLVATKEQVILVLLSLLVSFPVSYYLMAKWLEIFAFRISQGIMPFLIAGVISMGIAVSTMIYFAWKAASKDPVKVLGYE